MGRKKRAPVADMAAGSTLKLSPAQAKALEDARAMPRSTKEERVARRTAIRSIRADARANG